jgi:hypothetical protein
MKKTIAAVVLLTIGLTFACGSGLVCGLLAIVCMGGAVYCANYGEAELLTPAEREQMRQRSRSIREAA